MKYKALFLAFDESTFHDMAQVLQIAKAEARKIVGSNRVKMLNVIYCPYPKGYVVVVQNPGREARKRATK